MVDPTFSTAYTTRTHALAVFDTLYGLDEQLQPHPQMVAGHVVEDGGLTWRLTLRDGLVFHDGAKVLARDCAASLRRWGVRDAFGQALMDATNEIAAPEDRTLVFRLKRPFPLLPVALGRSSSLVPAIMPQRLAETDPFRQVTEVVGSGPFRFLQDERIAGARVAYARHEGYVPRADGTPSFTAGPRVAHVERVVFNVTDPATAVAALQTGDADWVEQPLIDLLPALRRSRNVVVEVKERTGMIGCFRFNHLHPPFKDPAIRRIVLRAINQTDIMAAVGGMDPDYWQANVGFFPPGSPMATVPDFGRAEAASLDGLRRELAATSYKGEKVVFLVGADVPRISTACEVVRATLVGLGFNVDYVTTDWGTVLSRINSRNPISEGGWSCYCAYWAGMDQWIPPTHNFLRANGLRASTGWPESARLEALRAEWLAASDEAEQRRIARELQTTAEEVVPYVPLGLFRQPSAYRRNVTGILNGAAVFTNLRKG